jgi:hypothetical protein
VLRDLPKQLQLPPRLHGPREAPIAKVGAIRQARIALSEELHRLLPARREALAPPDFVEAAWVTAVAEHQILAPDAQPASDPDIDGVRLTQRALWLLSGNGRYGLKREHGTLDPVDAMAALNAMTLEQSDGSRRLAQALALTSEMP